MEEKMTLIKTERLNMQAFSDNDIEDTLALLYNDEIKQTYMVPDFQSREEAIKMFVRLQEMSCSSERFVYGIKLGEKLIGFINEVDIDGDTIEVGYVIHPDHKNNGYATEVLQAAIQELFRVGYSIVRVGIFQENSASRRVIEKCGLELIDLEDDIEYRGKMHHCIYFEKRNV